MAEPKADWLGAGTAESRAAQKAVPSVFHSAAKSGGSAAGHSERCWAEKKVAWKVAR